MRVKMLPHLGASLIARYLEHWRLLISADAIARDQDVDRGDEPAMPIPRQLALSMRVCRQSPQVIDAAQPPTDGA